MPWYNRRRPTPAITAPVGAPALTAGAVDVVAPPDPVERNVIRAGGDPVPDWTRLAPLAPLLPPVPLTLSRQFEDSLVSWKAPHRSLADLGHAISSSAPSGVVEGIAVLAAEPFLSGAHRADAGTTAATDALPLAMPPEVTAASAGGDGPLAWEDITAAAPMPVGEPVAVIPTTLTPTTTTTGTAPAPIPSAAAPLPLAVPGLAQSVAPAGPEAVGLVGQAPPLSPPTAATPVATGSAPTGAAQVRSLVRAPSPPEMPLVQLPAARLPGPAAGPALVPPAAPLVAASPDVTAPTPPATPGSAALPLAPSGAPPAGVDPVLSPGTDRSTGGLVSPPAPSATGPSVSIPPVGDSPTLPLPLAPAGRHDETNVPAVPAGRDSENLAPLVGAHPPLSEPAAPDAAAEPTGKTADSAPAGLPLPVAPDLPATEPARPKSGLGAPLASLPPTAAPLAMTPGGLAAAGYGAGGARSRRPGGTQVRPGKSPGLAPAAMPLATVPAGAALAPLRPGPAVALEDLPPAIAGRAALPDVAEITSGYLPTAAPLGELPGQALRADLPAAAAEAVSGQTLPLVLPSPLQPRPPATGEGAAVRTLVGQRHGVDLSLVPVDRSPAAAEESRRMGARGYSSPEGVVIPAELGSLDAGPARALLAHELTHVAQRARLGPDLPPEHTPAGRTLEAEALSAEMALAPPPASRALLTEPSRQPGAGPAARSAAGAPTGLPAAAPFPLATTSHAPSKGLDQAALAAALEQLSMLGTTNHPAVGQTTVILPPALGAPRAAPAAAPAPAAAGAQRAVQVSEVNVAATPPDHGSSVWSTRPPEAELTQMAQWLYPLISYQMRGELREQRERSGRLTDTYRRW